MVQFDRAHVGLVGVTNSTGNAAELELGQVPANKQKGREKLGQYCCVYKHH